MERPGPSRWRSSDGLPAPQVLGVRGTGGTAKLFPRGTIWACLALVFTVGACPGGGIGPSSKGGSSLAAASGASSSTRSGSSSGGSTSGADAGCTPGDGGNCPFCGADNFVVACPSGLKCPRGAVCGDLGNCVCPAGYSQLDCDGGLCSRANPCSGTGWWCAPWEPGVCGPRDQTVLCGGGSACPSNSTCAPGGQCDCGSAYSAVSCSGQSCNATTCEPDAWWCAPRQAGACGPANFTLSCADGGYLCPTHGVCLNNGASCSCGAGYVALDCAGNYCDAANASCQTGDFWCVPTAPGPCGALNLTVSCPSAKDLVQCPTHGVCGPNSTCPGCAAGYTAVDCSGTPCAQASCMLPNWWCVDAGA